MNNLIEKLKVIAVQDHKSNALFIEAAIDRIKELEAKLAYYEEDMTDWKVSVETQMKRRRDDR
jgi:alpha/beta superfamily hydrolase